MAMAAGAVFLRSVATKMARAPPRLPYAPSSRFSTSTGRSTPPSANLGGPQTHHNNNVSSGSEWYRAIVAFNEAAPIAAFFLFGGIAYMRFFVSPELDRIEADLDAQCQARVTMREEIKKSHERIHAILFPNKESQIEATDVSEGQRITGIRTTQGASVIPSLEKS